MKKKKKTLPQTKSNKNLINIKIIKISHRTKEQTILKRDKTKSWARDRENRELRERKRECGQYAKIDLERKRLEPI